MLFLMLYLNKALRKDLFVGRYDVWSKKKTLFIGLYDV